MNSTRSVLITVTNNCNLECVYCYEHNKQQSMADFDTVKAIIDAEFDKQHDLYIFDFFGGEPLLNFEVVKQSCEYIWSTSEVKKKDCKVSICTNGTLVHGEIQKWIRNNQHRLSVGLSIDGTEKTQNINRSNSFGMIDLEFFKSLKTCNIKATISKKSLPNLFEDVLFLHSTGIEFSINPAYDEGWDERDCSVMDEQLQKCVQFYNEHPEIEPCRLLNMPLSVISKELPLEIQKYCGIGTSSSSFDIHGKEYACQILMPLSGSEIMDQIEFKDKIPITHLDEKCQRCPVVRGCPTCYATNYRLYGNIYHKGEYECILILKQFLATAQLVYSKIASKKILSSEDRETLYRINKLLEYCDDRGLVQYK